MSGTSNPDVDGGYTYNSSDGTYYHANGTTKGWFYMDMYDAWYFYLGHSHSDYYYEYSFSAHSWDENDMPVDPPLSNIEGTHTWIDPVEGDGVSITVTLA